MGRLLPLCIKIILKKHTDTLANMMVSAGLIIRLRVKQRLIVLSSTTSFQTFSDWSKNLKNLRAAVQSFLPMEERETCPLSGTLLITNLIAASWYPMRQCGVFITLMTTNVALVLSMKTNLGLLVLKRNWRIHVNGQNKKMLTITFKCQYL